MKIEKPIGRICLVVRNDLLANDGYIRKSTGISNIASRVGIVTIVPFSVVVSD